MSNNLKHNASGYTDPTAFKAICESDKYPHEVSALIKKIKYIIRMSGYELEGRITIKSKKNGKVYR